ncbi:MAG: sulfatase-like hydrolase/transferase, partial [Planctomycetaceae bacterium]
ILAIYAMFIAIMIALTGVAPAAAPPRAQVAPNVVLIVSDDQHWSDYGFMGHPQLRTPSLDRLARESLVFTRGYVPSSLCCPSLASIITGRFPHQHRIVGNDPPESPSVKRASPEGRAAFESGRERMNSHLAEWPTLPQLLGRAGFRSLQTGKWWQGDYSRGGFDEGMTRGQRHGDEGLAIGRLTMQPIYDFMESCREAERPFFIWYAPMLPHDPHDPEAELVEHYSSKTDSVHLARYWGNVERFDRTIGDLLDHLDRVKLADDTLVVYVTDNGWLQNLSSPRFAPRSKLSPYDGGLRTPIMLRQPGRVTPGRSESLASSIDIAPTILTACGIDVPSGMPGVNLLDAGAAAARKQIFGECYTHTLVDLDDPSRSLLWRWTVRDRFKLIVPVTAMGSKGAESFPKWEGRSIDPDAQAAYEEGRVELYDLLDDPSETHNLAPERPQIVAELRTSLDDWWNPFTAATPPAADGGATSRSRRPNRLVFLADDLGLHDLGCTGSSFYRTPTLDRLAAEGMLFDRGYAICPVCSPTRAGLVTGRHPARVRITNFIAGARRGSLLPAEYLKSLPHEELTVAERLKGVGYSTGVFGKWHLGPSDEIPRHGFGVVELTTVGPGSGPSDDPLHAKAIAAAAARFISGHRDQPWFCYVPMHSVHVPLVTRPDLAAEEARRAVQIQPVFDVPPQHAGDPLTRSVQDHPVYAGMIREMDETVATVLAAVDDAGQADDTIVIFTSDNGGLATAEGAATSNLPQRAGKGFVYEGGLQVPLSVRWPRVVKPGSRCATPVTTLDLAATIIDVSGAPADDTAILDGTSLRPIFAGAALHPRDLVWHDAHYSHQGGRPAAAILAGDGEAPGTEKLVLHYENDHAELFDLATDPGEYRDLSSDRPERTVELVGRLRRRLVEMDALMPVANPTPVDPFGPDANPATPRRRAP